MNWKTGNYRIWLFRALVLIVCTLMLISFIKPWWIGRFGATGNAIYIYGWGLRHNLASLSSYVAKDVTPIWQIVLAWIYVGATTGLVFFSTWLKKWKSSLLLGIIGLSFIAYAAVAINIVVENRLAVFKIPLEGFSLLGQSVSVYADLQPAYYLALITGGSFVVLALLYWIIVGKRQ